MNILVILLFGLLIQHSIYVDCSCNRPDDSDVVRMCYDMIKSGTELYLETNLSSSTTISSCSCTLTATTQQQQIQVDFFPRGFPLSCYYKTDLIYERSTGTFSCLGVGAVSFYDVKDATSVSINLVEHYATGSKEHDSCIRIQTSASNTQLELKCIKADGIDTNPVQTSPTLSTTTMQPTSTSTAVKPTTSRTTAQPTTTMQPTTTTVQTSANPFTDTTLLQTTSETQRTTSVKTITTIQPQSTSEKSFTTTIQPQSPTVTSENTATEMASTEKTVPSTDEQPISTTEQNTSPASFKETTTMYQQGADESNKLAYSDLPVPIGVGVGSFLLLVAFIGVVVCAKRRKTKENSALIENGEQSNVKSQDTSEEIMSPKVWDVNNDNEASEKKSVKDEQNNSQIIQESTSEKTSSNQKK